MSVYRPSKKGGGYSSSFFHFDFIIKLPSGERRRFHGSTGQRTRRAAESYESSLRELAAAGKLGHELTISAAAERYYQEVASSQTSKGDTAKSLEHLCRLIGAELPLVALDANRVADAARRRAAEFITFERRGKRQRAAPPKSPRLVSGATVNRQIVETARRLLRRAKRIWRMPVDIDLPWGDLKLPEAAWRVRVIASAERQKLTEQTRDDYAPILAAYQITGARKAALCLLQKRAVDFERDGFTIVLKRKRGDEPRLHFIPFTPALRTIFQNEMAKSPLPYVFTYVVQRGPQKGLRRPITYNGLRREWDRARAGLEDLRFHDQRHDAATAMARATGNVALAGKLLGHADVSSTQRYIHFVDDDLRGGMQRVELSRSSPEGSGSTQEKKESNR